MRHNQNKHSTANHGNSQHEKPNHMTYQYGGNDLPNPQRPPKRSVLSRFKERFQEKPATAEEVKQLGLNAKREIYKTAIHKAKSARPGRLDRISGGFGGGGSSRGRSTRHSENDSIFLGSPNKGGGFLDSSEGPTFDFITGGNSSQKRGSRKQESGLGKGLTDLF